MKKGNAILTVIFVALVAVGGGYWLGKSKLTVEPQKAPVADAGKQPTAGKQLPPPIPKTIYQVPVGESPSKGPADALVTIVMFSDFQCPFCSKVTGTIKKIEENYKGKVRFFFKQNPLPFHPNAPLAAEASLAAHDQGKFWEMHDKIFANQQSLDRATFEKYAQELGLDMTKFKAALDNSSHKEVIARDQALAQKVGANGTPSFFLNGRNIRGAYPYESFKTVIDEEIAHAEELIKKGTAAGEVYAAIIKDGIAEAPKPEAPGPDMANVRRKVEWAANDPEKGGKTPKVTIVEFSDFQCPFCSRVVPTIEQIAATYKDDVKIIFKQSPLPFHKEATPAAIAALAAHEQGKFWQMHDKLFANQRALDSESLEKYAAEIGLNIPKFKAAMADPKLKARVESDTKAGQKFGVDGTPSFFINGKLISGALPFEQFKKVIDEEIAQADAMLKKGIKKQDLYAEFMKESKAPGAAPSQNAAPEDVKFELAQAASKGSVKASVTIVEFSDFECPFCSRASATVQQITDTYKDKVRIVFKHQPLPFHQNALLAAQAAEAAHEQGKFWQMHDKLFANQRALSRADLVKYAGEIGLNVGKFEKDLENKKIAARIAEDQAEAQKAKISGTPTFFINSRRVVGAAPFERFKDIIDEELKGPVVAPKIEAPKIAAPKKPAAH